MITDITHFQERRTPTVAGYRMLSDAEVQAVTTSVIEHNGGEAREDEIVRLLNWAGEAKVAAALLDGIVHNEFRYAGLSANGEPRFANVAGASF